MTPVRMKKLLVVEFCAGTGRVAHLASKLGADAVLAIDRDSTSFGTVEYSGGVPFLEADLVTEVDVWRRAVLDKIQQMGGPANVQVVMWASPECRVYSQANTTDVKALPPAQREARYAEADHLMRVILEFHDHVRRVLGMVVVLLVENPMTSTLWSRKICSDTPLCECGHMVHADYCRFGDVRQKPTSVMCSVDLAVHLPAPVDMRCNCDRSDPFTHPYPGGTQGVRNKAWRSAIPPRFTTTMIGAVMKHIGVARGGSSSPELRRPLPLPPQKRARPAHEVADVEAEAEYMVAAFVERRVMRSRVHYLVSWEGHTDETWEPAARLRKDLDGATYRRLVSECDNTL